MCGGLSSQGMTGKMPVPPQNLCRPQGVGHIRAVMLVGWASRPSIHKLERNNPLRKSFIGILEDSFRNLSRITDKVVIIRHY